MFVLKFSGIQKMFNYKYVKLFCFSNDSGTHLNLKR